MVLSTKERQKKREKIIQETWMADYFSVCLFTAQRNQHAAFKCSPMKLIRGKGHRQCQQFHFHGFPSSHHPGKAISWVIATALFATACFCTSASTMQKRGQSGPWGATALQIYGSQRAAPKGMGTSQGLMRGTSQGPHSLWALQTEREDSFCSHWRYV